jgi:O-antigen/teichoic acid export membrane protein
MKLPNLKELTLRKLLFFFLPKYFHTKLQGRDNFIDIILNINWLLLEKLFKILFGFFVTIYEARYLGAEQVGLLYWAFSFVSLFAPLSHLGLNDILVRDLVKSPQKKNDLLGTSFYLKLFGGFLLIAVSVISISLLHPGDSTLLWMIIAISFGYIAKPYEVIDCWFQSLVKSKYAAYSRMFSFMSIYVLKVIFILTNRPLIAFALMFSVDFILTSIGFVFFYIKSNKQSLKAWQFSSILAKQLLKESWPIMLTSGMVVIMSNIDQVMIGEMLTENETGQFAVARKLIDLSGFLPVALVTSFAPAIARAKVQDEDEYRKRLLKLYRVMFYLSFIVIIGLALLGVPLVKLFYGVEFSEAGGLLALFGFRTFLASFGTVRSLFITNDKLFRLSLISVIVGLVSNVVLNYFMIPVFRSAGAILATYIAFFISNFVCDFAVREFRSNFKLMMYSIFDIKGHYYFFKGLL